MYIYVCVYIYLYVCVFNCVYTHLYVICSCLSCGFKPSGYSAGRPNGLMDVGHGRPVESEHVLCKSWLAQRLVDVRVCVCV